MPYRFHVAIISLLIIVGKCIHTQAFTSFRQACGLGLGTYIAGLEKLYPLIKWCCCHLVKVIHPKHIIFREQIACRFSFHNVWLLVAKKLLVLPYRQFQGVVRLVQTNKLRLSVINVVFALAKLKIDYIDGIHLAHILVWLP